ncbi:MAG: hypothetical protein A2W91_01850 [Bacteroidetes bacterium GWF2_38_335]|nr:MAG: hypothetical protein A2W91_01850 [Bacteroidetes bacterium GWF2_38_335]OFY78811.1 MAG: hypothetical protein A2281_19425 [Bacteroidetes bacterium RIFOXYA12_FULL_38_20]HBS85208.1 hypothetical protein [Bacteroidales bacterium]
MGQFEDKNIELIKNSFVTTDEKAPEFVWESIDKHLYIDRTWHKMKAKLDYIQIIRKRRIAAVYLISLLFIAGSFFYIDFDRFKTSNYPDNNLAAIHNNQIIKKESQKKESEAKDSNLNRSLIIEEYPKINSKNQNRVETYDQIPDILSSFATDKISNKLQKNNIENENKPLFILHDSIKKMNPLSPKIIDNQSVELSIIYSFIKTEPELLSSEKTFKSEKNQIGLIYELNNTMLINNEFIEGYREGSLISIVPSIASSYGFIFNHYFSNSGAISSELFFVSNQNQHTNVYLNGKYYTKGIELNYTKAAITFHKKISFNKTKLNSCYFIKAGSYFSVLTRNTTYFQRNNETTHEFDAKISNIDFGLKFALGREIQIKNVIIGCGFQSEYGLNNIFMGSESIPSDFDRTNNFNFGVFLNLKKGY